MDAAWTRRRYADAELTGELRIRACHESRGFFVTDLDEADVVLPSPKRLHDSVDAVTRQSEHDVHAPIMDGIDQTICCSHRHGFLFLRARSIADWNKQPRCHRKSTACSIARLARPNGRSQPAAPESGALQALDDK